MIRTDHGNRFHVKVISTMVPLTMKIPENKISTTDWRKVITVWFFWVGRYFFLRVPTFSYHKNSSQLLQITTSYAGTVCWLTLLFLNWSQKNPRNYSGKVPTVCSLLRLWGPRERDNYKLCHESKPKHKSSLLFGVVWWAVVWVGGGGALETCLSRAHDRAHGQQVILQSRSLIALISLTNS